MNKILASALPFILGAALVGMTAGGCGKQAGTGPAPPATAPSAKSSSASLARA
jgi:hypothetical protein